MAYKFCSRFSFLFCLIFVFLFARIGNILVCGFLLLSMRQACVLNTFNKRIGYRPCNHVFDRNFNLRNKNSKMFVPPHSRTVATAASLYIDDRQEFARVYCGDPSNNGLGNEKIFELTAEFSPAGDQPHAIHELTKQIRAGNRFSVLHGITGTGKTLVMSHIIANAKKPCLVLCHNKTLAAQLARELRSFLGKSAVELFVSYYNHYVPESFNEVTGRYIAKKSSVNAEIDTLRHRATRALLTRDDVVVVASVSCIYGLGLPEEYLKASFELNLNQQILWPDFENILNSMLYEMCNNDEDFVRGHYQVRQLFDNEKNEELKIIVLWPPHEKFPLQIKLRSTILPQHDGQNISNGKSDHYLVSSIREGHEGGLSHVLSIRIFPAKHHVVSDELLEQACLAIENELDERLKELKAERKHADAERLQKRVINDVYMMRETGFCSGGENYSRHLYGRAPSLPPYTLLDYLGVGKGGRPRNWLLIVDESHVCLPQLGAMYAGDHARKRNLVKHGYRLPSAFDNRPLKEEEFWNRVQQAVFISATPSHRELSYAACSPVKMVIRPTYVCDPVIEIRPTQGQLKDLVNEVRKRSASSTHEGSRSLAVTLTKRDAEDLASYMNNNGIKSTYLHSGLTTHERSNVLKALQNGDIECLVGVNLLREGLDLPQVSLVAVLNADAEGFLRCETSLLQTVGRAARNTEGHAIFYADRTTESMRKCIEETKLRRTKQLQYNKEQGYEMRSTKGSSMLSIFDLLKDQMNSESPSHAAGQKVKEKFAGKEACAPTISKGVSPDDSLQGLDTDHIPNHSGVYLFKDSDGCILYIGKAVKLRSRVRSYLTPKAVLNKRIRSMLKRASSVDFILTPGERDALVLESNLIKHHQPMFNVLLKDDKHYPFICASIGDPIPRFFIVPHKHENSISTSNYRYYGPYTSLKEANVILEAVENVYGLREQSFLVRHESASKNEYLQLFDTVLEEVFQSDEPGKKKILKMRSNYEEAGLLFDSKYNHCRDIVIVSKSDYFSLIVHLTQLRDGIVVGNYLYRCHVPWGASSDDDYFDAVYTALTKRHYPSAPTLQGRFGWFPDEILLPFKIADGKGVQNAIRLSVQEIKGVQPQKSIKITTVAGRGPKRLSDIRALQFAMENAHLAATESFGFDNRDGSRQLHDDTAAKELAALLSLDKVPSRIECYDVSHTVGKFPVASRVVFVNGKSVPHWYRKFNIRTVDCGDDYASMEEVLERRFLRLKKSLQGGKLLNDDPWSAPDLILVDGGKGQLIAAIKGIEKAGFCPRTASQGRAPYLTHTELDSIAVCALAKNEEQLFVPGQQTPLNTATDSPALLLLRALRDESHRFALNAHRNRRSIRKSI